MRNKIVMITAALAVMMAMTGIAAANPESVVVSPADQDLQPSQSLPGGSFATYNIAVSLIIANVSSGNTHTINATTTGVVGGGTTADLMYRFHFGALSSTWLSSGVSWTWTDSKGTSDSLTVDVMDTGSALNTKYQFKVYDIYTTNTGLSDDARATVYGTSIPEFATVAIPIAAVLGLVFFFQQRKNKKE
ncbi:MAG: PEF-CTERM sorting domain-containing protein [Candidatus Methanoperedens sp.]|nr:PEF-CTERM sorting domain-containing protein [Candidatus Methanoperedens sp.]